PARSPLARPCGARPAAGRGRPRGATAPAATRSSEALHEGTGPSIEGPLGKHFLALLPVGARLAQRLFVGLETLLPVGDFRVASLHLALEVLRLVALA